MLGANLAYGEKMEEKNEVEEIINQSEILKQYKNAPIAKIKLIKFYVINELIKLRAQTEEQKREGIQEYANIKSCLKEKYDYLLTVVNGKYNVDSPRVKRTLKIGEKLAKCTFCKLDRCIRDEVVEFLMEIEKINQNRQEKIKAEDVINYFLQVPEGELREVDEKIFNSISQMELLFIDVLLESELVEVEKFDKKENKIYIKYVNLQEKQIEEMYIDKVYEFFKNKTFEKMEIDLNNFSKKKDKKEDLALYRIRIAGYFKYLIQYEKLNILKALKKYIQRDKDFGIDIRGRYFYERFKQKIYDLPYDDKVKNKLVEIFNYILSLNYESNMPFIPINFIIYSEDKESVKSIADIFGDFMWFFCYLPNDMRWYDESMNSVILDKFYTNRMFYNNINGKMEMRKGVLTIHDFENIIYTDDNNRNLILNILTDYIERCNNNLCTTIYGNKKSIKPILEKYPKLYTKLLNVQIDLEDLDYEKMKNVLLGKLEKTEVVSEEFENKLLNYIKVTYNNSEIKNMEYVNNLYNQIILKKNKTVNIKKNRKLEPQDIPEIYNTKESQNILKDLNELIGLEKIKEQINDLIYLLEFNKKANLDISKFNLHMMFVGNPGTGKTTVARIISSILYKIGYTKQDKLVEVSAKDLIANYVGQTAGKTFNVVKSALGGVLFIDEAYAISGGENGTFGDECIATLVKAMEDYRDRLIIIFAGYVEEMKNFVNTNAGFASRIGYQINFDDYSTQELKQIFDDLLRQNNLKITPKASEMVENVIDRSRQVENFGNGRYINKLYQNIVISHAKNTENLSEHDASIFLIDEKDIDVDKLINKGTKNNKIGF